MSLLLDSLVVRTGLRRLRGLRRRERLPAVCPGRLRRPLGHGQILPLQHVDGRMHGNGQDDDDPRLLGALGPPAGQVRAHEAHGPQPRRDVSLQPRPLPVDGRVGRGPRRRRDRRARDGQGPPGVPRILLQGRARNVVSVLHGGRRAGPHPEHRRGRADHGAHDVQPRHLDPRRGAGVRLRPRHGRGARHGRGRLPRLLRSLPGAAGRDHPQLRRVDARLGVPHGDGRGRARVCGRLGGPELALARDDGLPGEPFGHDQGAPEPGPEPPRLRRRLQLAHVLRHGGLEDPAGQAPRLPHVGLLGHEGLLGDRPRGLLDQQRRA